MAIHNAADNAFKRIFGDHRLFIEFLRDFIQIDVLEGIKPEDIEDISERFLPLFQENRDADTVKRIKLKGHSPLFVIAILEHESKVNYRSSFKMLQYICLVLDAWEKEAEKEKSGSSLLKDFKYPPVLPMILYDGKGKWTAERNFLQRTHLNKIFEKYIPKFEYELINLNDYSEEELMKFGGALSYLLLVNKLRNNKGNILMTDLPPDYFEKLQLQIPDDMNKLLVDVAFVLLEKSGGKRLAAEQASLIMDKAKQKDYGGMFEVMIESMKEGQREAWAEGHAEGLEKGHVEGLEKGRAEGRAEVHTYLLELLNQGLSVEEIKRHLEQKKN